MVWIGWAMPPRRVCELLEARGFRWRVSATVVEDSVICFAPGVSAAFIAQTLANVACAAIVHRGGDTLDDYAELLERDRLFYLSRGALSDRDLAAIIESAAESREPSAQRELSADVLRRIALAQSLNELASSIRAAVVRTVSAERGRCLLFDRDRQVLWSPSRGEDDGESIAVGLSSFVLHTAASASIFHLVDDPRFDPDLDNPDGRPTDRFLGAPVRTRNGEVIAVLVALRSSGEREFDALDVDALEALASHVAPYLAAWMPAADSNDTPFRAHALRELAAPAVVASEPLRLDPRWMRSVPLLATLTLALILLAAIFVRVPEYASANATIRDAKLVATFPARHAAQLHRGMPLRFTATRAASQALTIDSVATSASSVTITARVPSTIVATQGRAEVRLRSERLLFALFPNLRGAAHG
ncbi:MAG TPA: GAF domain-containing protein [Thermoanaerobaculia bacterium]